MSLLTDTDLRMIVCKSEEWSDQNSTLQIYPYSENHLTPVGYDISVGKWYAQSKEAKKTSVFENDQFDIEPKQTVFICSLEQINMPRNKTISAIIASKVRITASGIVHDCTSIDPDWKGNLLIVLHNLSNSKITLKYGQPICTVIFFKNQTQATKYCGKSSERNDILVEEWNKINEEWNKINEKAAKRKKIKNYFFSFLYLIICFGLGYKIFGNNAGLSAFIAISIFTSKFIWDRE